MPAPITISVPVEHADTALAAMGGLTPSAPMAFHRLAAGPIALAPPPLLPQPGPMAAPTELTPASAQGPAPALPGLPPVELSMDNNGMDKWNRFFKPALVAAGSTLLPAAMPFIPGTPQHTGLEQALRTGEAKTEAAEQYAQGQGGAGKAAQDVGLGRQQQAMGGIKEQEERGGLGTSTANEEATRAHQAALGFQVEQNVLGGMGLTGNPGSPAGGNGQQPPPGSQNLAPAPINLGPEGPGTNAFMGLPTVVTNGPITDNTVNQWNNAAERLSAAGGFVPQLAPLANQVGRTAGAEQILAREQNTDKTGSMNAETLQVFNGILNGFAQQGYDVNSPQVRQSAMLLAMQQRANAGVASRQNQTFRTVTNANGQQELVPVTTVTGPAGQVPGAPLPPHAHAGSAQNITQPNGLPTLAKPNQQTITSMSQLLDTFALMKDLQQPLQQLAANANDPSAVEAIKSHLNNYLYGLGVSLPNENRDVVTQLGGLLGVVGGSAFAKASRRYELIEQAMQHLPNGKTDPREAINRLNKALQVYPQMLGEQLRSQWGSNADVAALQYHIPIDMPAIGYRYAANVTMPDGKHFAELAKVGDSYYDPQTGQKVQP